MQVRFLLFLDCASVVQGERRGKLAWPLLSRRPHSPLHLNCNGKGTTISPRCQIFGIELTQNSTPIQAIFSTNSGDFQHQFRRFSTGGSEKGNGNIVTLPK